MSQPCVQTHQNHNGKGINSENVEEKNHSIFFSNFHISNKYRGVQYLPQGQWGEDEDNKADRKYEMDEGGDIEHSSFNIVLYSSLP